MSSTRTGQPEHAEFRANFCFQAKFNARVKSEDTWQVGRCGQCVDCIQLLVQVQMLGPVDDCEGATISNREEEAATHCGSSSLSSLESLEERECYDEVLRLVRLQVRSEDLQAEDRQLWEGVVAANIQHSLLTPRSETRSCGSCCKGPEHLWLWPNVMTLESCCHTWERMIACCEAVVVVWVGSGLGGFLRQEAPPAPRYPFFLPCPPPAPSSPLPSSLTPGQLLQRSLRSTSSSSLFNSLPSPHIPSVFPRLPHGTPQPHHAGSSAIPPMLSTNLSPAPVQTYPWLWSPLLRCVKSNSKQSPTEVHSYVEQWNDVWWPPNAWSVGWLLVVFTTLMILG